MLCFLLFLFTIPFPFSLFTQNLGHALVLLPFLTRIIWRLGEKLVYSKKEEKRLHKHAINDLVVLIDVCYRSNINCVYTTIRITNIIWVRGNYIICIVI